MFTLTQFVALQTKTFSPPWRARSLLKTYNVRTLAVRRVIEAFDKQVVGFYVDIRSLSLLNGVHSVAELQQRWNSGDGLLQAADIPALQKNILSPKNIVLKLVTSDFRRGMLIGSNAAMAAVPTVSLNTTTIEDVATGVANIAQGGIELGAVIMALGALPEPASPVLIGVGAAIGVFSIGVQIGVGIWQVEQGSDQTPPAGPSATSTDGTAIPQPDGESVTVPDGQMYGDPPQGVNSDQLISTIVNDLGAVPQGWDLNTGSGLPGFPGGGEGDPIGGGNGIPPGLPEFG